MLAPVTNRGDAIGVLELFLPHVTQQVLDQVEGTAHALAYILVTDRRFTDLYHWGQRTVPVTLAAEIQRRLLPTAPSCEAAEWPSRTTAAALSPPGSCCVSLWTAVARRPSTPVTPGHFGCATAA
ncbi:hypothetical protein MBT84_02360 [Streptomyces sp. MBT84]|nr:hypothetical protein [Streptomyces sp. MBT84]